MALEKARREKIVVLDDELDWVGTLKHVLPSEHFDVEGYVRADEALNSLVSEEQKSEVGCLFVDLDLKSGKNGFDFILDLAAFEIHAPTIVFSVKPKIEHFTNYKKYNSIFKHRVNAKIDKGAFARQQDIAGFRRYLTYSIETAQLNYRMVSYIKSTRNNSFPYALKDILTILADAHKMRAKCLEANDKFAGSLDEILEIAERLVSSCGTVMETGPLRGETQNAKPHYEYFTKGLSESAQTSSRMELILKHLEKATTGRTLTTAEATSLAVEVATFSELDASSTPSHHEYLPSLQKLFERNGFSAISRTILR